MNSYNCELYEYVMESALFEVNSGNTAYQAVYEAAEEKANASNDNFFIKLKTKIVNFCRSIIAKAKMILSKIGNLRRTKVANKALSKLTDTNYKRNGPNFKVGTAIGGVGKNIQTLNFLTKKLNSDIPAMNGIIEKLIDTPAAGKSESEFEKISYSDKSGTDDKAAKLGFVDYDDMKRYLDNTIKYANRLNQSFKNLSVIQDKLKSSGYSASQIRIAISSTYTMITKYLKKYFDEVMLIYGNFMNKSSHEDKTTKDFVGKQYDIDEKMRETIDRLNNKTRGKTSDDANKSSDTGSNTSKETSKGPSEEFDNFMRNKDSKLKFD